MTAMRTVTSRLTNIKLGNIDEDGTGINDVEKALARVNIKLRENETTFRDMEDVLGDVAKGWKSYDDVTKASLLTTIGGVRQREYLIALFENYDRALELSNEATNSAGLAQERYGIYMESTEAKIKKFTSTVQELYSKALSSGTINNIIDLGTGFLNLTNSIGGVLPILTAFAGFKLARESADIGKSFMTSVGSISEFIKNVKLLKSEGASLSTAFVQTATGIKSADGAVQSFATSAVKATAVIGGLIVAFSLIYMAVQMAKKAHEDYVRSCEEAVNKTEEELNGVDELKKQYEELYFTKDRTKEQNEQLQTVQDKLTKSLKLTSDALDASKMSWDELSKSINNATLEQLDYLGTQQEDVVTNAKEAYDNTLNTNTIRSPKLPKNSYSIYTSEELQGKYDKKERESYEKIRSQLQEKYGNKVMEIQHENGLELYFDRSKMSAEELDKALKDTQKLLQDNKGLSKDEYEEFAVNVTKTVDAYEKYNEEVKKAKDYDDQMTIMKAKQKAGIDDITKASQEQLAVMEKELSKGVSTDGVKSAIEEIKNQIKSLNEATDESKMTTNLDKLKAKMTEISALPMNSENSTLLSEALKTLTDNGQLTSETVEKLTTAFPVLSSYIADSASDVYDLSSVMDNVQNKINNYASSLGTLDTAIDKVTEGGKLSGEEINNLTSLYPQLQATLDKTTGTYYIELDALKAVRGDLGNTAKSQIDAEIDRTRAAIDGVEQRIEAYLKEQVALGSIAEYNSKYNTLDLNVPENIKDNLMQNEDFKGKYEEALRYTQQVSDMNKLIEQLENKKKDVDIIQTTKGSDAKDDDKNLSYIKKNYQDQIDLIKAKGEELARQISNVQNNIEIASTKQGSNSDYVKKLRDNLTSLQKQQKDLISSSATDLRKLREDYFAMIKQSNGYFDGLNVDNFSQVDLNKALTEYDKAIQNLGDDKKSNELELAKSRVEELGSAIVNINSELNTLSDDYYSNKKESLDEYISRMQDALSYEEKLYDKKNTEYENVTMTLDVEDSGYLEKSKQINEDLIASKLKLQEKYKADYYQILKETGGKENDTADDLYNKWHEVEKDIFDMKKDYIDKTIEYQNKQFDSITAFRDKAVDVLKDEDNRRKDAIDKQEEALEKEADLRKEALEARKKELQAVKDEYDNQKKINDLRQSMANTISDLNALRWDDNAEAIQAKIDLANQLTDDKQALTDEMFSQAVDAMTDAIDKQIDAIEKNTKAQTDALEKQKTALESKTDKDYRIQANTLMETGFEELYKKLNAWNLEFGTGLSSTISALYEPASKAMQNLNVSKVGVDTTLNNLQLDTASKESAKTSLGATTFDGKSIMGSGTVIDGSVGQFAVKEITKSLSTVLTPIKDMLSSIKPSIPQNISNSPQFVTQVQGFTDEALTKKVIGVMDSYGQKFTQKFVEPYINNNKKNVVGWTR